MSLVDAFADFVGGVPTTTLAMAHGDARVWDAGRGPPLVMLHGIAASRRVFFRVVGPLAEQRRVLVPALRGEERARRRLALDDLLDDVAALLEGLDLRGVTLFGFSFGGWLALAYGARRDPRVERIVVQGGFARYPLRVVDRIALEVGGLVPPSWASWYFRRRVLAGRENALLDAHDPALALLNAEWQGKTPVATLRARTRLIAGIDLAPRLPSIAVPLTLLQGTLDPVVPRRLFDRLRALCPGAGTALLDGAGHLAALTHPVELARAILSAPAPTPR